jgi:DNA-binding SARP family transcriptional activator/tetratricopeptide (TPR) repeat protein
VRVRARLFGSIAIETDGRTLGPRDFGGIKPKQLLEILLVERGRAVSKDRLADLLWGEALPENVPATLEKHVSILRRQLGGKKDSIVVTEPGAYRLDSTRVVVDLDEFDGLVARGDRASLDQALALARGEVLLDEPYGSWAVRLREQVRARHVEALVRAADLAHAASEPAVAAARAEEAIALDPACERAHRRAMAAFHALGRQEDALRAFQRCRTALRDELGVDPQQETMELRDAIARREPPAAARPMTARAAPREVPFLGRKDDLEHLARAAGAALAGAPALLLVEGEAGVGKSRLVDEVLAEGGRLAGVPVARAKCFPLDAELPFAPLAALVRQLAPGPVLADVTRFPCLAEIVPELGEPHGGESARGRALESLVRLVSERAPVALVVDDLQWADASTLAALDYLRRRGGTAPFVIVGTFRSEDVGPEHRVRQMGAAVHVDLAPLTPADLADFGGDALHARTGGNALYVVECARAGLEGDGVPSTLREVILGRSRAAGPDAHRLLAAASILGRSFDPEVLAALLETGAVDEALEQLCERRLLRADGARFDFRHDLIRETLASSLSPSRRRRLHARALALLEACGAGPAELASHAEAAGDLAAALRLSTAAGDAARARFAHVEAAAHYARALRLAEAAGDRVEPGTLDLLLVRAAWALLPLRRHAEALEDARRARDLAEARGDDRRLLDALEVMAMVRHLGASDPAGALESARLALAVAERLAEPGALARAHALVGSPSGSLGLIDDALRHSHEALAQAARAGLQAPPFPTGRIALMLHFRGREVEAIEWARRAEEAASGQRDEQTLLMSRWVRALALAALGRVGEAWRTLDSMEEVGREESFWRARVPNTYGSFLHDLGLHQRALERDRESLEIARGGDSPLVKEAEIQTVINLAADRLALGRLAEARADVEWVRRQTSLYARFRWMTRLHAVDAELCLAEGDPARARAAAGACLVLAEKVGQPKNVVRARLGAARALLAEGRRAEGGKQARAAARLAEDLESPHLAWRAWHLAGDLDRARATIRRIADALEDPLRRDFLRAVPVLP